MESDDSDDDYGFLEDVGRGLVPFLIYANLFVLFGLATTDDFSLAEFGIFLASLGILIASYVQIKAADRS